MPGNVPAMFGNVLAMFRNTCYKNVLNIKMTEKKQEYVFNAVLKKRSL